MKGSNDINLELQNKLIDTKFKKIEERLMILEKKNITKIEPLADFLLMVFRQSMQKLFDGITQDDIETMKTTLTGMKKKIEVKHTDVEEPVDE